MNLYGIIHKAITDAGADGLVNTEIGCGCDKDDFAPCDSPGLAYCELAAKRKLVPGEYIGDCGPGDDWYTPIEVDNNRD